MSRGQKTAIVVVLLAASGSGWAIRAAAAEPGRLQGAGDAPLEMRAAPTRPPVLPALYAGLAALQALDLYSTTVALEAGAREANPLVRPFVGHPGAAVAVKAAATATTIAFVERLWKRHRTAAVLTMVAVNTGTALVSLRNLQHAHR